MGGRDGVVMRAFLLVRAWLSKAAHASSTRRLRRGAWAAAGVLAVAALIVAVQPPESASAITGDRAWAIVMCNFSNQQAEPHDQAYYSTMFGANGAGEMGLYDYWNDVSYGQLNILGTTVIDGAHSHNGWYTLDMTRDQWENSQNRAQKILDCANAAAPDADFSKYYGVIAIFPEPRTTITEALNADPNQTQFTVTDGNPTGDPNLYPSPLSFFPAPPFYAYISDGPNTQRECVRVTGINGTTFTVDRGQTDSTATATCGGQGTPAAAHNAGAALNVNGDLGAAATGQPMVSVGGQTIPLALVVLPHEINPSGAAHEMGHGFGLNHSRTIFYAPTTEYNDCSDVMSIYAACDFNANQTNPDGTAAFPDLNGLPVFGGRIAGDPIGARGPGLDTSHLDDLNLIPGGVTGPHELVITPTCIPATVTLHSLTDYQHALDGSNLLEVRIPVTRQIAAPNNTTTTSDYYTLEYREKTGWDSGLPANSVVVHLHGQDGYEYLEDNSFFGQNGFLAAGNDFADIGNTYGFVDSTDTTSHTATVTLSSCPFNAHLAFAAGQPISGDFNDKVTINPVLTLQGTTTTIAGAYVTAGIRTQGSSTLSSTSCLGTQTDLTGTASCTLTLNQDPAGQYAIFASFSDAAFNLASVSTPFTVNPEESQLTYTGPSSTDWNDQTTVSARLVDPADNTAIQGQTVSFDLGNGDNCSAPTDATGTASCAITPAQKPGSTVLSVGFSGGGYYNASGQIVPFTLNKEDTYVVLKFRTNGQYHDATAVSAQLLDAEDDSAIAGKTITFTLANGDTCSSDTDPTGTATCPLTPTQGGNQNITASFAGDTYYLGSSRTHLFVASPEETTLTYTGPTVILAGASGVTLSATMAEDGTNDSDGDGGSPAPVPAQLVTLSVGSQSCIGMTDASGQVTCTIPAVTVALGPQTVSASFAGNVDYQAASSSESAIVFAFPGSGAFALGDTTVAATSTGTVTWWSNNWYLLNNLSGGTAPPAFKGFVATIGLPATTPAGACSGTWTTSGGNSATPPSTVPSYMGVIVTSHVTKPPGNVAAGSYVKIVVVKTNGGYAPGPTNSGTGTVVATFCG